MCKPETLKKTSGQTNPSQKQKEVLEMKNPQPLTLPANDDVQNQIGSTFRESIVGVPPFRLTLHLFIGIQGPKRKASLFKKDMLVFVGHSWTFSPFPPHV